MLLKQRPQENACIRAVIAKYFERERNRELPHPPYPKLNQFHQRFCADQHDRAVHAPDKPSTKTAYQALVSETLEQFEWLCQGGYVFELWPYSDPKQPYDFSCQMRADVYRNKHLWIFKTGKMPDRHPMAEKSIRPGWVVNDVFRGVHDVCAHAWGGFSFGARGEDAAYNAHTIIYSPAAIPALCAETRMQSAHVIFGEHLRDQHGYIPGKKEPGYIPLLQRNFPDQKSFAASPLCYRSVSYAAPTNPQVSRDIASYPGLRLADCA